MLHRAEFFNANMPWGQSLKGDEGEEADEHKGFKERKVML